MIRFLSVKYGLAASALVTLYYRVDTVMHWKHKHSYFICSYQHMCSIFFEALIVPSLDLKHIYMLNALILSKHTCTAGK
jgi:hypothetical protein